ncbi:toll/interleukin-1 receptor domain-containing protein [Mycobacteroides franklinii]|uniref:toll/interleukin-1 receptor domain-containing protein n=1 Tax=Mycobacteroides franklinii TaxID=948102 RepID=UPI000A0B3089|nr:toll/interleukin-1 receptor domain-containing protein [Mycobacteroides franklinii]ORA61318.1 hypothetical protein BST24_11040 [Mycobacteroides franklinii]
MRKVFISYARANKPDVDQLVEHLTELNCQTWVDSSLHGGQDWWQEILRRIADCDVFIPVVSHESLNSGACAREFDWAENLGKSVLPVALERPSPALPRRILSRQIVDYSNPEERDRAARKLGGGLLSLPPAPPLPHPMPQPPAAPLSYLTDLVEKLSSPHALSHEEQRQILARLDPPLRSLDPEERQAGRAILDRLGSRSDLYADVDRTIGVLKQLHDEVRGKVHTPSRAAPHSPQRFVDDAVAPPKGQPFNHIPPPTRNGEKAPSAPTVMPLPKPRPAPIPRPKPDPHRPLSGEWTTALPATLLVMAAITGAIPPIRALSSGYDYGISVWYWQTISRILIGIAFSVLAWSAKLFSPNAAPVGWFMAPIMVVHVINDIVVLTAISAGKCTPTCIADPGIDLMRVYGYPLLLGVAALVGIAFGFAVFASTRAAWAPILAVWGFCGVLEAILSYIAKVDDQRAPEADAVLIVQNAILLVAAIVMYQRVRPNRPIKQTPR